MQANPRQINDIVKPQRPVMRRQKMSMRQRLIGSGVLVLLVIIILGSYWLLHRNDQTVLHDRYQVVYLVTGQIYFGKLQNTGGQYLTLKNVYTVDNQATSSNDTTGSVTTPSKILKVSQQVYGPDDSMAIRADQVQFWQNLRTDSKVVKAIESSSAE